MRVSNPCSCDVVDDVADEPGAAGARHERHVVEGGGEALVLMHRAELDAHPWAAMAHIVDGCCWAGMASWKVAC
jgi:hypothetical protein